MESYRAKSLGTVFFLVLLLSSISYGQSSNSTVETFRQNHYDGGKTFTFSDNSECAKKLGLIARKLPLNYDYDSKKTCLNAYIHDKPCQKEYTQQLDFFGVEKGIKKQGRDERQKQALNQCGDWLKRRQLACKAYLHRASAVCNNICETDANGEGTNYRGGCQNGLPHGYGSIDYANATYKGNWIDGKKNGHGVYAWASGNKYQGNWIDGRQNGHAVYIWASGNKYEGNVVNGRPKGHGVQTWSDGARYEGNYVDGKKHGDGVYTWPSGRRCEGYFVNNKLPSHC